MKFLELANEIKKELIDNERKNALQGCPFYDCDESEIEERLSDSSIINDLMDYDYDEYGNIL